jgi:hypothetical protein
MSERGSFVTSYGVFEDCAEILAALSDPELWPVIEVRHFKGLVAGYLNYSWSGEAVFEFEENVLPKLEAAAKWPLQVAIMEDDGKLSQIFNIEPAVKEAA